MGRRDEASAPTLLLFFPLLLFLSEPLMFGEKAAPYSPLHLQSGLGVGEGLSPPEKKERHTLASHCNLPCIYSFSGKGEF